MGEVEAGAELMAQLVDGKILGRAQAGEPVVGETARPHQLAHGLEVAGIRQGPGAAADHRAQQPLGDLVGEQVTGDTGEIAVQSVHHDIHHAAGDLVGGEGAGQFRIHHCKAGADPL